MERKKDIALNILKSKYQDYKAKTDALGARNQELENANTSKG